MHKQDVVLTSFGSELREIKKPKHRPTVEKNSTILNVHGNIIGEVTDTHEVSTIGDVLEFYTPHSKSLGAIGKLLRTLALDSIQDDGFAKPWFEIYEGSKVADCPLERHDSECDRSGSVTLRECNTLRRIEEVMFGRRAFLTEKGDWGVGPSGLRKGDSMVNLDECRFPFVKRRQVCSLLLLPQSTPELTTYHRQTAFGRLLVIATTCTESSIRMVRWKGLRSYNGYGVAREYLVTFREFWFFHFLLICSKTLKIKTISARSSFEPQNLGCALPTSTQYKLSPWRSPAGDLVLSAKLNTYAPYCHRDTLLLLHRPRIQDLSSHTI